VNGDNVSYFLSNLGHLWLARKIIRAPGA